MIAWCAEVGIEADWVSILSLHSCVKIGITLFAIFPLPTFCISSPSLLSPLSSTVSFTLFPTNVLSRHLMFFPWSSFVWTMQCMELHYLPLFPIIYIFLASVSEFIHLVHYLKIDFSRQDPLSIMQGKKTSLSHIYLLSISISPILEDIKNTFYISPSPWGIKKEFISFYLLPPCQDLLCWILHKKYLTWCWVCSFITPDFPLLFSLFAFPPLPLIVL